VGCGRFGAFHGAAGLHRQDWLFSGYLFGNFLESGGISESFDIGNDDPCAVIISQVANNFGNGHITGIAVGSVNTGADTHLGKCLMDHFGHTTAESDNGDKARIRHGKGEIGVGTDVQVGIDDSLAVRSHDTNAVFFGRHQKILFKGFSLRADFGKAPGIDNDILHPFFAAVFHSLGYKFSRNHHVNDIDAVRTFHDRLVGFNSPDFIGLGVDRIYFPFEPEVNQVFDHPVADGQFFGGRTDNGC